MQNHMFSWLKQIQEKSGCIGNILCIIFLKVLPSNILSVQCGIMIFDKFKMKRGSLFNTTDFKHIKGQGDRDDASLQPHLMPLKIAIIIH